MTLILTNELAVYHFTKHWLSKAIIASMLKSNLTTNPAALKDASFYLWTLTNLVLCALHATWPFVVTELIDHINIR
jgi:hypothetical protein